MTLVSALGGNEDTPQSWAPSSRPSKYPGPHCSPFRHRAPGLHSGRGHKDRSPEQPSNAGKLRRSNSETLKSSKGAASGHPNVATSKDYNVEPSRGPAVRVQQHYNVQHPHSLPVHAAERWCAPTSQRQDLGKQRHPRSGTWGNTQVPQSPGATHQPRGGQPKPRGWIAG